VSLFAPSKEKEQRALPFSHQKYYTIVVAPLALVGVIIIYDFKNQYTLIFIIKNMPTNWKW